MTDPIEAQNTIVQKHFEAAIRACVADGVPLDFAVRTMVECGCGGLKGVVGPALSKKEIHRIRDDIWAELTLHAQRCGPAD